MTASAPSGTTPPVAIPIASPGCNGLGDGRPAATRKTTGSVPGVSARANREPVHRAARERRQIDHRRRRLGEHATRRLLERHPLRRQRLDALEHEALGLRESQKLSHDRAYRTRGG